jgi:hypothetical protein
MMLYERIAHRLIYSDAVKSLPLDHAERL